MSAKKRLGILISGRGSNMAALIEACQDPDYPAEIAVVISNRPDAKGLDNARAAGLRAEAIDHKAYDGRESFEDAMQAVLEDAGVDLLLHAGFMRIVTEGFVNKWLGKSLNIHPSLLPSFGGLHVHEQALEAGVKITGATVHFVTNELDGGPIVGQIAVPVLPGDTPDTLGARVLEKEHLLFPLCVKTLAEGKVRLENDKAVFADDADFTGALV